MTRNLVMQRPLFLLLLCLIVSDCSGIEFSGRNGESHFVIIGIGVVSVARPAPSNSLQIVKSDTIGIHALLEGSGLASTSAGLSSKSIVVVGDEVTDLCGEVSYGIFAPLLIETCTSSIALTARDKEENVNE